MGRSLDEISVSGFKSINEMDQFELRALNVLIGANGAGKSNFISLFKLLNEVVNKHLQVHVARGGGADSFLYYGRKTTDAIHIRLKFGDNGYEISLSPSTEDNLVITIEKCWYHYPNGIYPVPLTKGSDESKLEDEVKKGGRIAGYVLDALKSWKVYHFHDTSDSAKVKQTGDINDNAFFRPDAGNLAAYLFLLKEKHEKCYDQIISTVRLAAPFFDNFILRPSPLNPDKIRLEWKEKDSDIYFNASHLSDGTLRFISLATLLLQPQLPAAVILDEPELGLHPSAINLLVELLRGAATRSQVLVSTQSVPLVNQLLPEEVVVVERYDRESIFKRLTHTGLSDWLQEYGLGELWEMNVLGGRP